MSLDRLPIISVISVVFNSVAVIEETITNVLNLPYPNINYIIIDGGSNDGTLEVINKYRDKLFYFVSEPDQGIYDAMNKGWAQADDASYILYLGAGDKVFKLPDMAQHFKSDIIYGDVLLGEKGLFKSSTGIKTLFGNTVHHQALLVRKSIHPKPPFSLAFKIYADFDFNQRLRKAGVQFTKDKDFYAFALEGGVSAQVDIKEYQEVIRKNYGHFVSVLGFFYYKLQQLNGIRKGISGNRSL